MKQIKYNSGGQPFFNSDFALQQSEIYKAIENQYADVAGGVVLSGCVVTGNSISAGLVYLDGKIRELASATGLSFPCYIKASPQIDYDSRVHTEDNQNKTTKSEFKAEITTTIPVSGDYITVTASGINRRLEYVIKNETTGEYSIDGYVLNPSYSYVEASRTTPQTLTAIGVNLVDFTSETDDLNEFNVSTGEFVASQSGVYQVNFSVRVSMTNANDGYSAIIYFWNGSGWEIIAESLLNIAGLIQSKLCVSVARRLVAGQKIRISAYTHGTAAKTLENAHLSIVRLW